MSFGQRIKALRREAGMTQEQLAELLSISPQAVSRWETDVAMPDISLLPPLANLFKVTTDHLLGMDTQERDQRKAEFDEVFREYWLKDEELSYQTALRAVAEYPGNMEYMEWLASAEYYVAIPMADDAEHTRLLERAVKHHGIVLDNCKGQKLYDKALHGIAYALCLLGRKDEAKGYAEQIENERDRDRLLVWCLEGEEKARHSQRVAETALNYFITDLAFSSKTLTRCDAVEKILEILFPDGNYQYYHNFLQCNAIDRAFILCGEGRDDEVIAALQKARFHAEQIQPFQKATHYRFTAPLFGLVEGDKQASDADAGDVDHFIRCLENNTCFDPIRDREDFRALLQKQA